MGDSILTKFKNFISVDEEEYEGEYEEEQYEEEEEDEVQSQTSRQYSKIVNLPTQSSMKVVIVEPQKMDEMQDIADYLKQKKTVIVNLENLSDAIVRRTIFDFVSGAVYVLDGTMQKVAKSIFILAPHNVNIDANLKKELESKTLFPWQSK